MKRNQILICASALIGFIIFPEVFSTIAIFLTYTSKEEFEGKTGSYLMALSIISLIVGWYITSLVTIGTFF